MRFEIAELEKRLVFLRKERDAIQNKISRIKKDQKFDTTSQEHKRLVRMIVELENDLEIELATTESMKTGISAVKKHIWDELILMDTTELRDRKQKLETRMAQSRLNQPSSDEDSPSSPIPAPETTDISWEPYSSAEDTSGGSVDPAVLDFEWHENYSTDPDDDTYSSCCSSALDTSLSSD